MKLYIKYFGTLTIDVQGQTIELEKILGRQLTMVFALLAFHCKQGVSKTRFIDTFWSESENPSNALKFSIHRLRQMLKAIEPFHDKDIVVTTKQGYKLNDELEIVNDYDVFTQIGQKAMKTNDLALYQQCLDIYQDDFLISFNEIDQILLDRAHYKVFMTRVAESFCVALEKIGNWDVIQQVCLHALRFDELNEELIYYYVKSLMETKQFNDALKYYEAVNARMHRELGVELQSKTSQLLNIMGNEGMTHNDENSFSKSLMDHNGETLKGPLYCDYPSFKKITQFEIRNSIRLKTKKFLLFISFKDKTNIDNDILGLLRMVAQSLRINDAYTRISSSQVVVLCSFNQKSDGYIVAERIINAYYHKISKRSAITYNLVDLLPKHLYEEVSAIQ